MTGRFSRSLELAKASWTVVRADKELLLLPVLSVVALVGAAMIRMQGGNPRLADGLRIAWQRVGRIFGYACIGLIVVGVLGVMLAVQAGLAVIAALVVLVAAVAVLVLSALHATLQGVYSAALYSFATYPAAAPAGFPPQLLGEAFRHKS
jgi:hypothetical protein